MSYIIIYDQILITLMCGVNEYLFISNAFITQDTMTIRENVLIRLFKGTVVPTKSDSDVLLCLQLLSKNNLYSRFELTRIDSSLVY